MKVYLITIALALSVVFNLGFVGGLVKPKPPEPVEVRSGNKDDDNLLKDIRLSDQQRKQVKQAVMSTEGGRPDEAQARRHAAQLFTLQEEVREELAKLEPDAQHLREVHKQMWEIQQARQRRSQEVMLQTLLVLTPEQRRHIAARPGLSEYRQQRWRPLRARFDTNHDGVLDEAERAAAREQIRSGGQPRE